MRFTTMWGLRGRFARPFGLALAILAAGGALGGCGCGAGSDAGLPPDAGELTVAIGTPTDVMAGFRFLADGDTVELVLGSQGAAMCFLRYVVPESVASGFTATVLLELEGDPPFERGPFMGSASFEPGIGYVTNSHRIVLAQSLLEAEGLGAVFTVTLTDTYGRTATSTVSTVLHDLVPCQDLGPGFCVPYDDSGTPNPSDSGSSSDAGDAGDAGI